MTGSGQAGDPRRESWGWEMREPLTVSASPFEEPPPRPATRPARWSGRLAASRDRTGDGGGRTTGLVVLAAAFGAGAGLLHYQFSGVDLYDRFGRWLTVLLVLIALLALLLATKPLLVSAWSDLRYRRWRKRLVRDQLAVADKAQDWQRRRIEHENEQERTGETSEKWVPLRPETTQRVDVYGGDPAGRAILLRQVAGSLLDSGGQVRVIDVSQDGIGRQLLRSVASGGGQFHAARVPDHLGPTRLVQDLDAATISELFAHAVHAVERSGAAGPGSDDRSVDAALTERLCGVFDHAITMPRLAFALKMVCEDPDRSKLQGGPPTDLDPSLSRVLSPGEWTALATFGARLGTTERSRLFRLSATASRLHGADSAGDGSVQNLYGNAQLSVWELSERLGETDADMLAQWMFHSTVHRLAEATSLAGNQVLVLAGCDRIARKHLERLDQLARARGIRLVLFFNHLRDAAVEVLGGSEAVLFMRLGNAKEAEHAATFIGKEHRLVASGFTVSRSTSWSSTTGTSTSRTEGENESSSRSRNSGRSRNYHNGMLLDWPYDTGSRNKGSSDTVGTGTSTSETEGTSSSEQSGGSTSESLSYQRTYEFSVEPTVLQRLSSTAFVLVDPGDQGSPRLGDCDPEIASLALPSLDRASTLASSDTFLRGIEDARRWARQQGELGPGQRGVPDLPGLESDRQEQAVLPPSDQALDRAGQAVERRQPRGLTSRPPERQ